MAYNIGPRISVQGEKEFNDSIKRIDQSFKTLSSEMRVVESQFAKNEQSTESLGAKKQVLGKQIENQKSRLAELTAQYQKQSDHLNALEKSVDEASTAYGENSKEADKARAAYEKQQGVLSSLQTGINTTTANLNNMERQLKDTNQQLAEMASKHLKDASEKVKEFGKATEDAGKKMMPATLAIAGAGAAAFKAAADLEDAAGATDQIFGRSSAAMKKWARDLESYYGIAENEALEYANMMGSMLQNIGGLTEQEAAKQSQTLIRLAGDLAAMYGGSTADAVRALTGALKGNNTMLDNYGMAANDAMIKTKALEMGLVSEKKELDLASKQAATLALIMEQTGAAQGQAAREADGASGAMRAFTAEAKDLAAAFGTLILPQITPLIQAATNLMKQFAQMDDGSKRFIITVLALVAAIGPLLIAIGKISLGVSALMGLGAKLMIALPAVGTFITATLIPALTGAATAVGGFVAAVGIVPIAIAAGVAALIAIIAKIADLWKTDENFRKNVTAGWNKFLDFFKGIGKWFVDLFTVTIPDSLEKMKGFFRETFESLVEIAKKPINGIIGLLNGAIEGINDLIRGLNKIKVDIPKWVPQIGGKRFGINIPEIGKIPMLATGGYLHQGSAIVGEAGAELLTMMGNKAKVTPLTGGAKAAAVTGGDTFYVTIDAKNVTDFNRVVQMANAARQQGRAF